MIGAPAVDDQVQADCGEPEVAAKLGAGGTQFRHRLPGGLCESCLSRICWIAGSRSMTAVTSGFGDCSDASFTKVMLAASGRILEPRTGTRVEAARRVRGNPGTVAMPPCPLRWDASPLGNCPGSVPIDAYRVARSTVGLLA